MAIFRHRNPSRLFEVARAYRTPWRAAPKVVKYLMNNRKHAHYWESTRDSALCVEAIVEFLKVSGEDKPDMAVEITLDGKVFKTVKINVENLFHVDAGLTIPAEDLTAGAHEVGFRKVGRGPLYFNVYSTYFTLEEPIFKTGSEINVERSYAKLVSKKSKSAVADARTKRRSNGRAVRSATDQGFGDAQERRYRRSDVDDRKQKRL